MDEVNDLLQRYNLDILSVSESWLTPKVLDRVLVFPGYRVFRQDRVFSRKNKAQLRGGGVAVLLADHLRAVKLDIAGTDPSVESLWLSVSGAGRSTVVIGSIYRPPGGPTTEDIENLRVQLQIALTSGKPTFVLGDFNINLLRPEAPGVRGFNTMLADLNLYQLVDKPTHLHPTPTLLDLVLTNVTGLQSSVRVLPEPIADHQPVLINVPIRRNRRRPTKVTARPWSHVDWDALCLSLLLMDWEPFYAADDINDKLALFMERWNAAVDAHCPVVTRTKRRPSCPWLRDNIEIATAMQERDAARDTWERTRTAEARQTYQRRRNDVKGHITRARRSYMCDNLVSSENRRAFWDRLKRFELKPVKGTDEPDDDIRGRADSFNAHFAAVGPRIAAEAKAESMMNNVTYGGPRPTRVCASALSLHVITLPELSMAISRMSSSKAVGVDGIPLFAIKKCFPVIGPHVLHLVNSSVSSGIFPDAWKIARVTPIFKSGSRSNLNNFRPISILSVLSKITEKVVCLQLTSYLAAHHIITPCQYAYRPCHSTEDALLDAVEWLSRKVDESHLASLTTIDLSKAFDSVDHDVLLKKLVWCGIAPKWFASYLKDRRQVVGGCSNVLPLSHGVPQGSLVGPILFLIFINDLPNFLPHGRLLCYADDTQILDAATPDTPGLSSLKGRVEESMRCLRNWFLSNGLKMNADKTNFTLIGSKASIQKADGFHINVSGTAIHASKSVKVLGVFIDQNLSWDIHISSIVRRCNSILISLYKIRHHFNSAALKLLVEAHVFPHITYCLSVWGGASQGQIGRVQKVLNFAARLVSGTRRREHISPVLAELEWTSVNDMTLQRDCRNVDRALHINDAPHALRDMFVTRAEVSDRQTRAVTSGTAALHLPLVNLTSTQMHFPYRAAAAWNRLSLRKTHRFGSDT